ncbi:MAG: hypothetical protein IJ446_05475 [Oscillospiraceae bacterium]|nr:hypothetical protein [Oscillospiraceae bacterium]
MRINNKRLIKKLIFSAAIPLIISLTGCTDSNLNKAVFVSSAAISYNGREYAVTVCGEAAAEDSTENITAEGKGRTLAEALSDVRKNGGYDLFFGHCEAIAADSGALRDSALFTSFSDSVLSPACRIYYSENPSESADKIPSEGFSEELYELAACCRNGNAAVIPYADNPARVAVITADEEYLLNTDDSLGVMILRDEAYSRMITAPTDDGFVTIKISPSAKRDLKVREDSLIFTAEIALDSEDCPDEAKKAAAEYISDICRNSFNKTVHLLKTDALNLCRLGSFTHDQLLKTDISITVK